MELSRRKWQLTLSDGKVRPQVELHELKEDSLIVSDITGSQAISVESITEVRYVREASFWKGAKTGAIIGGAAGAVIGIVAGARAKPSPPHVDVDKTTLRIVAAPIAAVVFGAVFGVVGGTIGGAVGAVSGIDEVYDLTPMNLNGKLTTIQRIITKHSRVTSSTSHNNQNNDAPSL